MRNREARMGQFLKEYKPSLLARVTALFASRPIWNHAQGAVVSQIVKLADVSFYQMLINFVTMFMKLNGVIIRAGQNLWVDKEFKTNWQKAKLAKIPRGSYWFYDSRVSPKQQAKLWFDTLGGDYGELFHAADFEENYGGPYAGWKHWYDFLVEFQRLTKLPDKRIWIYTGYYYWSARAPKDAASLAWFGKFNLWLAWYSTDPSIVRIPKPWANLSMWQYTSSGNGEAYGVSSKEIDLNYYNGDEQQYKTFFGINSDTVPPEPPAVGLPSVLYIGTSPDKVTKYKAE